MFRIFLAFTLIFSSCASTTYYIVRHAEKVPATTMSGDVPLSAAGQERALALAQLLKKEHIEHIYTTDFRRTRATIQPLADSLGIKPEIYDPRDTVFVDMLKKRKGSILVAGHSNTVDDLVNQLAGKTYLPGDLPDTAYGDLFVLHHKGNEWKFSKRRFGK